MLKSRGGAASCLRGQASPCIFMPVCLALAGVSWVENWSSSMESIVGGELIAAATAETVNAGKLPEYSQIS